MSTASLEDRVRALEGEVSSLKQELGRNHKAQPRKDWLDVIWGSFANDPAYLEAMKMGRKYRESTRPKPGKIARKNSRKKA